MLILKLKVLLNFTEVELSPTFWTLLTTGSLARHLQPSFKIARGDKSLLEVKLC